MFLELIATFVAGVAGAGAMMLLNLVTGRRLPRWLVPVAAGLAMLTMTISSEYGWYDRTAGALPDRVEVIETVESRAAYRPWTYLVPYVNRFIALDREGVQPNVAEPHMRLADLLIYGRWKPTQVVQIMVDCDRNARADPREDASETDELRWFEAGADDPIVTSVCKEG